MSDKNKRFDSIANIKTVCLLLVVFWHCDLFYEDNPFFLESSGIISAPFTFLGNMFNVTLIASFVFCSGFLFNYSLDRKNKPIPKNIWGRVKRLLFPYYVGGTLWLVPLYTFFDINSFGRPEGAGYLEGFKCMLLGQFSDHLWFLWMLFWISLIFILLSPLVKKRKMVVVSVIIVALALFIELFLYDFPYFKLSQIPPYLLCYLAGVLFFQHHEKIDGFSVMKQLIFMLLALAVITAYAIFTPQHFAFLYIARVSGGIMFYFLFKLLEKNRLWHHIEGTRGFGYVKRHSMTLYVFNMPFPYLYFRLFFPYVGQTPWLCVALTIIHVLFAMVVSVQIMMFFNRIFIDRRNRVSNLLEN